MQYVLRFLYISTFRDFLFQDARTDLKMLLKCQRKPQEGPKRASRQAQEAPRGPQERSKTGPSGPNKGFKSGLKWPYDGLEPLATFSRGPRGPKWIPRGPKKAARAAQTGRMTAPTRLVVELFRAGGRGACAFRYPCMHMVNVMCIHIYIYIYICTI